MEAPIIIKVITLVITIAGSYLIGYLHGEDSAR